MPKKAKEANVSNEELALMGIEYERNKKEISQLEKRNKELRNPLEDTLITFGDTASSGSRQYVITHAGVDVVLKHTCRASKVQRPEAVDVLKEAGLEECIEMVPFIREDVLEAMVAEGKVTEDLLKKLYVPKDTYAFSVSTRKHIEE